MIWDENTFSPEVELSKRVRTQVTDRLHGSEATSSALKDGNLKFRLYGEKLRGSFALVKTRALEGAKDALLLIKHIDEQCVSGCDANDHDFSAVSGRFLEQIAEETTLSDSRPRDWGTTAVLLIDAIATVGVATWGILYIKTDIKYLLIITAITIGLAFFVGLLLRASRNQSPDQTHP